MTVAVISANLGAYDRETLWPALDAPAGVAVRVHRFTDATCAPRPLAMTARLRCGLPKWFGPEFVPGADVYVWIDASCTPTPGAVAWFLEQLGPNDAAFFRHPDRATVREEYDFIVARMARRGETYLTSRYRGEWLTEQFAAIESAGHADARLFASTAFIYRPTPPVLALLKEVWYGKTRYHLHDQLWLAHAVAAGRARVGVIDADYLKCPAFSFTRQRR